MWLNTRCVRCNRKIDEAVKDISFVPAKVICQPCFQAQERDFLQKLPVKVRVLWEV